jgi:hypothetical protein
MPSTSNKPTRAAIYAPISTTEQDTGMQVAELRQVCGQRGWSIVAEHLDDGVSGVATARQGLDALLADGDCGGAAFGSAGVPLSPHGNGGRTGRRPLEVDG